MPARLSITHEKQQPCECAHAVSCRQMEACAPNTTSPLLRVNAKGDGFLYPTLANVDLRGGLLLFHSSPMQPSQPSQPSQIAYVQLAPKFLAGEVKARASGKAGSATQRSAANEEAGASPMSVDALPMVTDSIAGNAVIVV